MLSLGPQREGAGLGVQPEVEGGGRHRLLGFLVDDG
jgi:hypothetical protein